MTKIASTKDPLSVTHPVLVKEWNVDKNAPLSANDITSDK